MPLHDHESNAKMQKSTSKSTTRPRILGIDPGSRVVGFAVLESIKEYPHGPRDWIVLDAGVIRAPLTLSSAERLAAIHETIFDLISQLRPHHASIERTFHGINAASGIKLGEARGAIIAAFGRHSLPVMEYSPTVVKRTVGGSGAATKEQVADALRSLMGFQRGRLPLDATDALAIALTGALNLPMIQSSKKRFHSGNDKALEGQKPAFTTL